MGHSSPSQPASRALASGGIQARDGPVNLAGASLGDMGRRLAGGCLVRLRGVRLVIGEVVLLRWCLLFHCSECLEECYGCLLGGLGYLLEGGLICVGVLAEVIGS